MRTVTDTTTSSAADSKQTMAVGSLKTWLASAAALLAGAATVALLAVGGRVLLSPFRFLPQDRVWLFVGECPYSMAAFRSIAESKVVRQRIIAVPVVDAASPVGAEVCPQTIADLAQAGRTWLKWLPATWACQWLASDGSRFFDRHFLKFPSFSVGRNPIEDGQEERVLLENGIRIESVGDGTAKLVPREAPPSPRVEVVKRAPVLRRDVPPVNLPIGW